MHLLKRIAFVVIAMLCMHQGTSRADAVEDRIAQAKRHYEIGSHAFGEAMQTTRVDEQIAFYQTALVEFKSAYTLSPRPALLVNIGLCLHRITLISTDATVQEENDREAVRKLREYMQLVPDASDSASVIALITEWERGLVARREQARLAREAERAKAETAKAQRERAEADRKRVEADKARHTAESERNVTEAARRAQADRDAQRVVAELKIESELHRGNDRETELAHYPLGPGIGLIVVGVVSIGGGAVLSSIAKSDSSTVSNGSGEFVDCCASAAAREPHLANAGIALDVIGPALAITGVALTIWAAHGRSGINKRYLSPAPAGNSLNSVITF